MSALTCIRPAQAAPSGDGDGGKVAALEGRVLQVLAAMDKRLKAAEARAEAAEDAARRAAADTQALAAQLAELRAAAPAHQHAAPHAQVRIHAPRTRVQCAPSCDCAANARALAARAGRGTGWRCA